MPRKFFKRLLPDPAHFKGNKSLKVLDRWIHDPNLWHLNRHSVSAAFFVGLFCAFIPLPMQMLFAAAAAIMFHGNLPISVSLVWITNPITMPPVFYMTYKIGATLLDRPAVRAQFEISWQWFNGELASIWAPLLIGSLLAGLVCGLLGYITIQIVWRWHVVQRWQLRRQKRKQM